LLIKGEQRYNNPSKKELSDKAQATGKVSDFTEQDVAKMLEGISSFLADDFGA
jgi:hypothetical protein